MLEYHKGRRAGREEKPRRVPRGKKGVGGGTDWGQMISQCSRWSAGLGSVLALRARHIPDLIQMLCSDASRSLNRRESGIKESKSELDTGDRVKSMEREMEE